MNTKLFNSLNSREMLFMKNLKILFEFAKNEFIKPKMKLKYEYLRNLINSLLPPILIESILSLKLFIQNLLQRNEILILVTIILTPITSIILLTTTITIMIWW